MSVLTPILLLLFAFSTHASIEFSSKTLAFGNLLPIESKTLNLTLTNSMDRPIKGHLILDNPGLDSNENFGEFTKTNKEASLASWVSLSKNSIYLNANESETIELTINTPDAISGDYRAWLFISEEGGSLDWPYSENRVAITAQLNKPDDVITLDTVKNTLEVRTPIIKTVDEINPTLKIDTRIINKSPVNIETHGQCTLLTKEAQPILIAPVILTHTGAYERTRAFCLFSHYLPKDQYLLDIELNHKAPFINAAFNTKKRVAVYIRTKDERLLMDADARLLSPDVAIQSSVNKKTKETGVSIQSLYEKPITLKLLTKGKNGTSTPSISTQLLSPKESLSLNIENDSSLVISIKEDRKRMPLELTPKLENRRQLPLSKDAIQFAPQISIKEWNNVAHIFTTINYLAMQDIKTATIRLDIINKENKRSILKTSVPVVLSAHGHSPLHMVIPALDAGSYQIAFSIINKIRVISSQKYDLQVKFSNQFKVYQPKTNIYIRQFIINEQTKG